MRARLGSSGEERAWLEEKCRYFPLAPPEKHYLGANFIQWEHTWLGGSYFF
jgi:hypothetical protein